ncbi:MAG: hypothetical protein LBW85_14110 [Deltaproteobacteria bacterium]|jgi:hypothetical protein|nr:hypothetical protein [Deltaproteobacteria bacterium]
MADKTDHAALTRFDDLIARASDGSFYLAMHVENIENAVIGFGHALGQKFIGWDDFGNTGNQAGWNCSPLLKGWHSCLAAVPMYFVSAHFSNRPRRSFLEDPAEKGDFALTLSISLNRNCWLQNPDGEKGVPLDERILASPYRGPRGAVNVYRVVKSNPKSSKDLEWLRNMCGCIGENGPKMRWVRTRYKFLEGWTGDFSLELFLKCPEVLAGILKEILGLSSGCPREAFRRSLGPRNPARRRAPARQVHGKEAEKMDTEFETSNLGYTRYLIDRAENGSRDIVRYARALGASIGAFERSLGLNFLFWKDSGKIAEPKRTGPPHSQPAADWYFRIPLFFTEHAFSNLEARRFRSGKARKGDFAATLTISLLENIWREDSTGGASKARKGWMAVPASFGPRAALDVYKVTGDSGMSLEKLLETAGRAGRKKREVGWAGFRHESLEVWSEEFRLAAFLADPVTLAERTKKILGQ